MGKGASKAVNNPTVKTVAAGAVGFAVGGPVGAAVAAGAVAGAEASKEADRRQQDAIDELKGLKRTSQTTSKRTNTNEIDQTQTSQTVFDPKSRQEQQLERASVANFNRQQNLVRQQEQDLAALGTLENQGRSTLSDIATGDAFALTDSEQGRINAQRDANIAASSNAVNELINSRLAQVEADAARRGIRGQAFTQLQSGAIAEGARNLNTATLDANRIAADQALNVTGQRVNTQAAVGQGLATIQEDQRQRAINNRQLLQDPAALQRLRDERLRGGKTVQTNKGTNTTTTEDDISTVGTGEGVAAAIAARGQSPGSFASGVSGALSTVGALGKVAGAAGSAAGAAGGAPA